MRKQCFVGNRIKRAANTGLFIALLFGLAGCTKTEQPVVQPGTTQGVTADPTEDLPPQPTATPGNVNQLTGEPSKAVEPTKPVLSEGTPSPEPTAAITPKVTEGVVKAPTPEPEGTVTKAPTFDGTGEAEISPTPEITGEAEPTSTPEPTPYPDYTALMQSGWQRTEDFFGKREIFFSGNFTETELFTGEGFYEYRYTAKEEKTVSFHVVGEENLSVQPYLEQLRQKDASCVVIPEGVSDYSYTYSEGDTLVRGRVYACPEGGTEHRMRVELRQKQGEENQPEDYDFYLR